METKSKTKDKYLRGLVVKDLKILRAHLAWSHSDVHQTLLSLIFDAY